MAPSARTHGVTHSRSVVLLALLVAACGGPSPSAPSSDAASSTPTASQTLAAPSADLAAGRIAGWTADFDAIVPGLERYHPDPYHSTPKGTLLAAIDALKASIGDASDDELMTGVMRVVAMVSAAGHDAHTGAYVWGAGTYATHTLPLRLWVFPEGVAVVDALPPYEGLVGRTVTSIDGRPIADAIAVLDPLMPRDNAETMALLTPRLLLTTEVLHGVGLIDDPEHLALGFADDPSPVAVTAIPTSDYNSWATPYGLHLPTRADVPYLARSEEPVWTRVDGGTTLYVQYNRVTRLPFDRLDPLRTAIADPALTRVIVDIRHNYGGETFGYQPLADALVAAAPGWSRGLYLITGRNTFSAASLFAADLTARARVTVVGEPMGGSPSLFGNARDVSLPYSGLVLNVATEFFQPVTGDDRLELSPDLPVQLSLADYLAGRDPALGAIEGASP